VRQKFLPIGRLVEGIQEGFAKLVRLKIHKPANDRGKVLEGEPSVKKNTNKMVAA